MRLYSLVWFAAMAMAQIPPTYSIKVEPPATNVGKANGSASPVQCNRSMSTAGIEFVNESLMLIGV